VHITFSAPAGFQQSPCYLQPIVNRPVTKIILQKFLVKNRTSLSSWSFFQKFNCFQRR